MLLGDDLLTRVARVWHNRERIEWEAAALFRDLAELLRSIGAPRGVIELAAAASRDEVDHARRCRRLVDRFAPGTPAAERPPAPRLGAEDLSPRDRALYGAVALGCVTESLSSALLLRMRERGTDPGARDTIHAILRDEINHSRLGWAHLAWEAQRSDVSWLSEHVGAMLRAARASDVDPMSEAFDASAYGILAPPEVNEVIEEAIATVIAPGLGRFGIEMV